MTKLTTASPKNSRRSLCSPPLLRCVNAILIILDVEIHNLIFVIIHHSSYSSINEFIFLIDSIAHRIMHHPNSSKPKWLYRQYFHLEQNPNNDYPHCHHDYHPSQNTSFRHHNILKIIAGFSGIDINIDVSRPINFLLFHALAMSSPSSSCAVLFCKKSCGIFSPLTYNSLLI